MNRLVNSKDRVIENMIRDIFNVLNDNIIKYDLTFEEVLTITEKVRLHILAKYIDFRLLKMKEDDKI